MEKTDVFPHIKEGETHTTVVKVYAPGTFGHDLAFLKKHDQVLVLKNADEKAQVIISARYQGKVFTSTAEGLGGKSFGWINYKAFTAQPNKHMNAYGGEDRLWLGPEGGKYSIFFRPGTAMEFNNWYTPAAFDTENWDIVSTDDKKVTLNKQMSLVNYAGTLLNLKIERSIQILENLTIETELGIKLNADVKAVGFHTQNSLTNTGYIEWTKQTGVPCMWNLDMFTPSAKTVIIIPHKGDVTGKVATTNYFGEIPANRIAYKNNVLFFKADGKARGKLGISPERAIPIAGSYDTQNNILTVTKFDADSSGTYLNQEWTTDKNPLKGDVVNAYNDGALADGSQMGPFYEIESVSPGAFLKPGDKLTHNHSVFHFTGDEASLKTIAHQVFGISLDDVKLVFE